jgi:hypothetical protein
MMRFFHRTSPDAAKKILIEGFRDSYGTYGMPMMLTGVFVSDVPLDVNEGTADGPLFEIQLAVDEADIDSYELIEEGKGYREWCIPAAILNTGKIRQIPEYNDGAEEV